MKNIKDETIEEAGLPEQTPWESIGDHPRSLADLSIKDGKRLDDTEGSIGDIEDWKGYLDAILDAQTAEIIAEWTFKDSGALAIKVNASNGIWLSPTGILAKKAGVTTFAITSSGDATFGGSLIAGVSIESPVITGGLIRTSVSGSRIELRDNSASIWPDSIAIINIHGNDIGRIRGGSNYAVVEGAWLFPSGVDSSAPCVWENPFGYRSLEIWETSLRTRDIRSLSGSSHNLGASTNRWAAIYSDETYVRPGSSNVAVGSTLATLTSAISSLTGIVSGINSRLTDVENNCCD